MVEGRAVIVVEHEALGADGRSLDHLARPTRDEEPDFAGALGAVRKPEGAVSDVGELALAALREGRQQRFAASEVGERHAPRPVRDAQPFPA